MPDAAVLTLSLKGGRKAAAHGTQPGWRASSAWERAGKTGTEPVKQQRSIIRSGAAW